MSQQTKTKVEPKIEGHKDTARLRRCLLCGETFNSAGAHNRICKRCKSSQVWRQG